MLELVSDLIQFSFFRSVAVSGPENTKDRATEGVGMRLNDIRVFLSLWVHGAVGPGAREELWVPGVGTASVREHPQTQNC